MPLILVFGLIFLGVPIAFAILAGGAIFLIFSGIQPLIVVAQRLTTGLDSFPLLAVPLFIMVGNVMDRGGISNRLISWAESLVGHLLGGLGTVTIVACTVFAALTGSGPATVAAIGAITIPAMLHKGYTLERAGGLVAAAGALGPIIPPSIPMIIYGVTMGLSIPDMFMGGVIPGLLIAVLLIIVNMIIAVKTPEIRNQSRPLFSTRVVLNKTVSALGALVLPIIILGGIYSGAFTPTEAASVALVYSLIVGFFVYKELKVKDIPELLVDSMRVTGMAIIIAGAANLLAFIMSITQLTNFIVAFLGTFIHSQVTYLLVFNLFLLFVGCLFDTIAAIIIIAPIIVPLGITLGIDPLHIGVVFVINLVMGYATPPFGINLFTVCATTKLKFERLVRGILPFIAVEIGAVLIISWSPWMVTWLPDLLK